MTEAEAYKIFRQIRWPKTAGRPVCPKCSSLRIYNCKKETFICAACQKHFTVTSGTILHQHKMPISKYLFIMEKMIDGKNAYQISCEMKLEYSALWKLIRKLQPMVNQLRPEAIAQIQALAEQGNSTRQIMAITGKAKNTVSRYMAMVDRPDVVSVPRENLKGYRKERYLNCGYCDKQFLDNDGEKTSDIKCGRIKQAFCTHRCAMNFRSAQRHNDKCKRCNKTRKELSRLFVEGGLYQATGVSFSHGYCPKCWGLLRQYQQDEQLVQMHELTQTLKQEIRNDDSTQYGRPSEDASGGHRRRPQGKSGSPAGAGNQRPKLSNLTIRPVRL